ncbi:Uncharacterised protein [Mycobacteroides abscessus subsp. abscessus]|nr:Uncharacterised protein [Mycobacteroides abscessus subsp. abscessus]
MACTACGALPSVTERNCPLRLRMLFSSAEVMNPTNVVCSPGLARSPSCSSRRLKSVLYRRG